MVKRPLRAADGAILGDLRLARADLRVARAGHRELQRLYVNRSDSDVARASQGRLEAVAVDRIYVQVAGARERRAAQLRHGYVENDLVMRAEAEVEQAVAFRTNDKLIAF